MRHIIWLLCLMSLCGCLQQAAKPSEITLVDAMRQVGEGLNAMRDAQGDIKTGLIAESAEITFKITADSKNGGKLKVDLSSPAISEGIAAGGELSAENSSGRSNTVTVKFKNLLTLPKDTVGFSAANAQISAAASKSGVVDSKPPRIIPDDLTVWTQSISDAKVLNEVNERAPASLE